MNNKGIRKILAQRLSAIFLLASLCQGISYASIFEEAAAGKLAQINKLDAKSLKKTDRYGFTLLDYARDTDQKEVIKYLQTKKIDSGIGGKLIQQVQYWMSLLEFKVDNLKGSNTAEMKKSVLAYQQKNGLAQTGVIRPSWVNKLENEANKNIQQRLVNNGAKLEVNGKFDAATKAALKQFQASKNLVQSGELSEFTVAKLKEIKLDGVSSTLNPTTSTNNQTAPVETSKQAAPNAKTPNDANSKNATSTLADNNENKENSESSFLLSKDAKEGKVLDIQAWLAIAGVPAGKLDGDMGPDTRENIKSYQKLIGKKPTGELSADWESVLETKIRKKVQAKLKTLNFYKGDVDGINGKIIVDAIKAFEKKQGLKVTGSLNAITLVSLLNYGILETSSGNETKTITNSSGGKNDNNVVVDNVPAVAIEQADSSESSESESNANSEANKASASTNKAQKRLRDYRLTGDSDLLLTQLKLAYLGYYTAVADGKSNKSTENAVAEFLKSINFKTAKNLDKAAQIELDKKVITQFQQSLLKAGKIKDQPTGTMGTKTRKALSDLRAKKGVGSGGDLNIPSLLAMIDDADQSSFAKQYVKQEKELSAAKAQTQEVQSYLITLGYLSGSPTGKLDKGTQKAVSNFKARMGLKRSDELNAALLTSLKQASIKKMQQDLNSIGYPVKVSGQIDASTQKAIKDYQKKNKLSGGFSLSLVSHIDKTVREREIVRNRRAPTRILANIKHNDKPQLPDFGTKIKMHNFNTDTDADATSSTAKEDEQNQEKSDVIITTRSNRQTVSSDNSSNQAQMPNLSDKSEVASLSGGETLRGEPNSTIKGQMKIIRNDSGSAVGCKIGAITVSTEWCQSEKENDQCNVLYRNGRVLSVRCK